MTWLFMGVVTAKISTILAPTKKKSKCPLGPHLDISSQIAYRANSKSFLIPSPANQPKYVSIHVFWEGSPTRASHFMLESFMHGKPLAKSLIFYDVLVGIQMGYGCIYAKI